MMAFLEFKVNVGERVTVLDQREGICVGLKVYKPETPSADLTDVEYEILVEFAGDASTRTWYPENVVDAIEDDVYE